MGKSKAASGGEKKDEFKDLDETFKDAVAQSSTDEIRKRITELALGELWTREDLKDNGEINDLKDKLSARMEPYRKDLKELRLQIKYCKSILDDKGAPTAGAAKNRAEKQAAA